MENLEMLYRYAMRRGFRFNFTEDKDFKNVLIHSENSDKLFSYAFDKENNKMLYCTVDGKYYDNVDNALQDFDDYDLLRRG